MEHNIVTLGKGAVIDKSYMFNVDFCSYVSVGQKVASSKKH